jgi:hypothetical protein
MGIDLRKLAYRARLRIKANKHGNRSSKACDRARSYESKPKQACQSTSESQILPTTIVRLIPFRYNPLLIYPIGGYQQSIGTLADYVSVGDRWFIVSPYLQSLDMLRNWSASRLQSSIGTPTDRSLCHTFVTLSDRWISTYLSLGLLMNANEHNQLTSPNLMSTIPYVCLWVHT